MSWFKRSKEGITTSTKDKKETPEGLWSKCSRCKTVFTAQDLERNSWVCDRCSNHERIGSEQYFHVVFDGGKYTEINEKVTSGDPLEFVDTKKYTDRIKATQKATGLKDAIRTAYGELNGIPFVVASMDFAFIGGSMGSVMGEKIARAIDKAIELKAPFMIISKSGGARMMEAGFSLMQMAKVSGKLGQLASHKLPYISYLTDPTTGGVTASFAMLGDINIAEPEALIAFAGPRVVKETIGRDLPDGFQTSEFVLEHGFLDYIVSRTELKEKLGHSLKLFRS
ncbi:acetyl-CoA carboxylase, carboxyltransferase subunit beta [Fluviicola taffensis]|uniref:Acetyl-coenzyme A carboxylase carboxyl transferase subunit beta n=1 Tax=Fluviicola taffensis (strain DSM 16823 / NCIMB 13979 / RW262) TaxID=755732 RepID=F2ICB1_FLUTR|nr:acetyl-CoA carboxylase, carboxyltransferase subunit beta [Fluviicola taffensis]AEA44357.1 Acetyl-coenzyme A carboxylase carboxyl transferase subunit beta [Fluviicola taffensis DSM 16823]